MPPVHHTKPAGPVKWRGVVASPAFSRWTDGDNCEVQAARVPGACYGVDSSESEYGVGDGDIQIVRTPLRGSRQKFAFKHTIYQALNPEDGSIRADLYTNEAFMGEVNGTLDGQEQYWHQAFLLPLIDGRPQHWANYYEHNVLGDMHNGDHGTSANQIWFGWGVRTAATSRPYIWFDRGDDRLPEMPDHTKLAPLRYGSWYDLVLYVKWGTTPDAGHVTVWVRDGRSKRYVRRFDRTFQTMDAGDHPYFKEALYSGRGTDAPARTWTNSVVFAGACRGSTFTAVENC